MEEGLGKFVIITMQMADDIKQLAQPVIERIIQFVAGTCCSKKGNLICFKWIDRNEKLNKELDSALQEFVEDYGCKISFAEKDI